MGKYEPFPVLLRLRELYTAKGYSVSRLAREADIPKETIRSWYRKGNIPPFDKLDRICSVLGITLAQFFSSEDSFTAEGPDAQLLEKWHLLKDEQRQVVSRLIDELNRLNRYKKNAG